MSVLQTRELGVARNGRHLVSALNWRIEPGQFWCVLGKNGSGKTTLLHVLAGLIKPALGTVSIDGADIQTLSVHDLAQRRGMMPQTHVDAFSCSVLDAVLIGRMPYRIARGWDEATDLAAAHAALVSVGLAHLIEADILTLSGGERQRTALAALLVQAPRMMLLDEPMAHQDIAQQVAMMCLLRELMKSHAVIASCHDVNLAARFATHVLLLGDHAHWCGTIEQMLTVDILQQVFGCRFDVAELHGMRNFVAY